MHDLYPMLAKAMFSGGDEYTHRMTVTTEAFLLHRGDTWELSYTEPVEDGTDGTTRIWLPALDSAALTSDRYDITDGAEMLPGDARDKAVHTGKTLRITIPEDLEYDGVFDEVLNRYAAESELTEVTTTNMGSLFQLTYQLRLRERGLEKAMIDELRCLNGNLKISLGMTPQGRETL